MLGMHSRERNVASISVGADFSVSLSLTEVHEMLVRGIQIINHTYVTGYRDNEIE